MDRNFSEDEEEAFVAEQGSSCTSSGEDEGSAAIDLTNANVTSAEIVAKEAREKKGPPPCLTPSGVR